MNVSLRSQMVAGVAALGATAVAIVPIAQQAALPSVQNTVAAVQLTALANPVAAVLASLGEVNSYVLDTFTFDDAGTTWPDSFYGTYTYAPFNFGIIPDAVNQFSSGALSGLVNNLSGYGWAGIQTAVELGIDVSDSVFNTPAAVVTAVQELLAGDPQAAIDALVTGIIDPLRYGVQYTLAAGQYVLSNLAQNLGTVVSSFLPNLTTGLIGSVVGGVTALARAAIATAVAVVQDVAKLDIQAAWNEAVDGFLGPEGTLGQSINWAIGPGLADDQDVVTVASPRAVITSELQRLGSYKALGDGGISNDPFFPPSAAAAKAAAVTPATPAVEVPAVVEVVSPAVEAPEVEAPAASSAEPGGLDNVANAAAGNAVSDHAAESDAPKPTKRPARAAARGDNAVKAERAPRSVR